MNIRTSDVELKHLLISWIAISYAFTIADHGIGQLLSNPLRLLLPMIISLFTVGVGFLLHEMAHKVMAQRYGCWAEYRMDPMMLLFAVFLATFAGFVFAAPGAVYIFSEYLTIKENGKISASGPVTNLLLGGIFFAITLSNHGLLRSVGFSGMVVNIWLAAFNLIPFGPLDGKKVWNWNKAIYLAMAIAAFGSMALIIALLI